ncbi:hypothetical protein M0811_03547 [Anaeramoeba ignava]|uniref:Uncharacterized protein n=1 Tax=Anaeramoeba ignava TaxID=1746090 RepID=A0A9Q0L5S3_ANAIG|nr:hypothetical protein M0811_03547 [Anaeramoeba ignava]
MPSLLILSRILAVSSVISAFLGWVIPCLWKENYTVYSGYSDKKNIIYCGNFECLCFGSDCRKYFIRGLIKWGDIDLNIRNGLLINIILGGIGMIHIFVATSLFFKKSHYSQIIFLFGGLLTFIGLISFIFRFKKSYYYKGMMDFDQKSTKFSWNYSFSVIFEIFVLISSILLQITITKLD